MFNAGDFVQLIYGYGPHPDDPHRSQEVSETALFLEHKPPGLCQVLRTDGVIVECSTTRLRLCASIRDKENAAFRELLFPELKGLSFVEQRQAA